MVMSMGYIDESCGLSNKTTVSPAQERLMLLLDGSIQMGDLEETDWPHVYKTERSLFGQYVYWDRLFYEDLNPFCLQDLGMTAEDIGMTIQGSADMNSMYTPGAYKDHLAKMSDRINGYALKNKWEHVFSMIDKRIAIGMYLHCFEAIPDKKKWDAFVEMYTRCELGFEMLEERYEEIFSYAALSKKRATRLRKLKKKAGDRFTIYHGAKLEGSKWDPKDYYSWTLSKDVANFFAKRFNDQGQIWEREIDLADAVDYLIDRNEEEILVDYSQMTRKGEKRYAPLPKL